MAVSVPPGPPPSGAAGGVVALTGSQLQVVGEVVVEVVPERLALLSRTILLSGMITGQKEGGALILKTQLGELVIRSPQLLPLDRVLMLQIPPGAPPVRAQVSIMGPVVGTPSSPLPPPPSSLPSVSSPPVPIPPPPFVQAPLPSPAAPVSGKSAAPAVLATPLSSALITPPLEAILTLPILPGTVMPAKVLAMPQFTPSVGKEISPEPLPPALALAVGQLREAGLPALKALVSSGLGDVITHLQTTSLPVEPSRSPLREIVTGEQRPTLAGVVAPKDMPSFSGSRTAAEAAPKFSSLPAVLTLPPGSTVTVQINRVVLPAPAGAPAPASPPPLPLPETPLTARPVPLNFPAEVIGTTPQGEPIATSPAGLFILDSKAPLPVGTRVELSVVHVSEPLPQSDEIDRPHKSQDWPALQSVLANLPPEIPVRMPRPEAHLGSSTVFLLAALKLGDSRVLMPCEAEESLTHNSKAALLTALGEEMRSAGQNWSRAETAATQVGLAEWKSLTFPLPPDSAFSRLALHLRDEQESGKLEAAALGKRLVVEFTLSRLGPMLLDGLIFGRRMDMVLRSQRRLPQALHGELRQLWRNSLNAMNWSGELEFQTSADLWLGY